MPTSAYPDGSPRYSCGPHPAFVAPAELEDGGAPVPPGWRADNSGECRSCGEPITWATTPKGKRAPVNLDGTPHFGTCPQADRWRRR